MRLFRFSLANWTALNGFPQRHGFVRAHFHKRLAPLSCSSSASRCFPLLNPALAMVLALPLVGVLGLSADAQAPLDRPPYEDQLMRLAEILGGLEYLRPLCGDQDTPSWRERMTTLLDTETGRDEARRRRFVERFNQGYRGYASAYHTCTPSARLAISRYISEGSTLAEAVTTRYGR